MTNRHGDKVTTAVTNLDIHDIARTAKTYGALGYYLVTPIADQHEIVGKILGYWRTERSREYHPDRAQALELAELIDDFELVKTAVKEKHGVKPVVVMPDARVLPSQVSYAGFRKEIWEDYVRDQTPLIFVFGTGWGVDPSFYPEVDRFLAPIYGPEGEATGDEKPRGYNHLSVRAAAAIVLDRLLGH